MKAKVIPRAIEPVAKPTIAKAISISRVKPIKKYIKGFGKAFVNRTNKIERALESTIMPAIGAATFAIMYPN